MLFMLRSQQATLLNWSKKPEVMRNEERGIRLEERTGENNLAVTVKAGSRQTARDFRTRETIISTPFREIIT